MTNTMIKRLLFLVVVVGATLRSFGFEDKQVTFKRNFTFGLGDHIALDLAVARGDVDISFSRAGELSVVASVRSIEDKDIPENFFDRVLTVELAGNHAKIKCGVDNKDLKISYKIGVPDWIEINAAVDNGKLSIGGVTGPVKAIVGVGDIRAVYITSNLEARTGKGNITIIRVGDAAKAETGSGNINMRDIGPASTATVKKGVGRVEMDGISGSFTGSTDAGDLDVKGGVFGDWELKSTSGDIRILIPESKFDIDAATHSGRLYIESDDIKPPKEGAAQECRQQVNGGGKLVRARSESGAIYIK
ncbi:MAG TPA: DUF4097 family beta strand repeat-containing protein [Candidatus Angelobacter sp.]|nr:DUF4097 family beta strand repeat-containing protein [Candidatus Angelobacter sp.]